jgi:hypothetical protein
LLPGLPGILLVSWVVPLDWPAEFFVVYYEEEPGRRSTPVHGKRAAHRARLWRGSDRYRDSFSDDGLCQHPRLLEMTAAP